jgi:Response regulator containing a CheY-like receiver domain and an HTH DNA-binding domain
MTMLMEASENKLQIAEKDIVLKNRQLIIIVTVSGFIVLLISFFLLFMQYKKRQKEHENRELMAHLEHEKEIQAIEKQKQAELIDAKTREITSSSLLLSNKNNLLQQILELANLSLSNKGKAGEATQNIIHIVKTNLHIEEDWNNFMIHFDKVHPDFFEKMQSQYGNLTQNELKLCAYIRIGLSIKQIAQMLNISPASVKKNRYLLRKKLNLKEDENLDESIQHI